MSKMGSYVCTYEEYHGNLITGGATSGVKRAGLHYRLFYGTSEVAIVLPNRERKQSPTDDAR